MKTATATKITYRKTKQGEWVAFGPVEAFQGVTMTPEGPDTYLLRDVTVTKKSGQTKVETIDRIGKPFTVDGTPMCYGYIAAAPRTYTDRYDHEDCLSTGGCGHGCPYNWSHR